MKVSLEGAPPCANCGSTHVERYCATCGQKRPTSDDYSVRAVLVAAFERITLYDGRLLQTFLALVRHPGRLARDHFDGKRGRYVPPFEIFVITNVIAWIVAPLVHISGFSIPVAQRYALLRDDWPAILAWREGLSGQAHDVFMQRIEASASTVNKLAILCLVPLFALACKSVVGQRRYGFVHHLIFAVHYYSVHIAAVLIGWGLIIIPSVRFLMAHPEIAAGRPLVALWKSNWVQHLSVAPVVLPYLYLALKRTFQLDRRSAASRAFVLTLIACTLLRCFFDVGCILTLVVA